MPGPHRFVRLALLALTTALGLAAAAAAPAAAPPGAAERPRNVILMIPDGCGPAAITLARLVSGHPLVLDSLLVGAVETHSADSDVTDSAASGTAYATGVKTRNRMLGVDPDERPLGTLVEAAKTRGLATGLVTTADLTDATPAAFVAHVAQRTLQDSIAVQMLQHRVDVLLGGDRSRWLPRAAGGRRGDGRDLLAEFRARGGTVVTDPAGLAAARELPLLGLFGIDSDQIALEIDRDTLREPSLAQMTAKALELLGPAPRGFFLLIEGGRIDDAGHDDDPAGMAHEVLAYDRAVGLALDFARRDRHTLVVSAADHETGGLGLGRRVGRASPYVMHPESLLVARASVWRMSGEIVDGADPVAVAERGTGVSPLEDDERAALLTAAAAPDTVRRHGLLRALSEIESRRVRVGWSTGGHTAVDVGLYAFGPGSERFRGLHENTDVSRLIASLLRLDLDAETARLRGATGTAPRR
jgi:alkaline phosphatase